MAKIAGNKIALKMNKSKNMYSTINKIQHELQPVQQWISNEDLDQIYSSSYWNDIDEEKKKEWWISGVEYSRCLNYLEQSGLMNEWLVVQDFLKSLSHLKEIKVCDLAAGIGWTSALLSKIKNVVEVHAVEISKHRIIELFPYAIDMLNGDAKKITRYIGSFYDLGFLKGSMDIVLLSQAFHHSDKPLILLTEIDRVLKTGGVVILSGEHYISKFAIMLRIIKNFIKFGRIKSNFYDLFPPDNISGDHYYRLEDYYLLFRLLGYQLKHKLVGKSSMILIAKKL